MIGKRSFWRGSLLFLVVILTVSFAPLKSGQENVQKKLEGYPWVFLRGGQPVGEQEDLLELLAVGDTSLARGVQPDSAFSQTSEFLRTADLVFANLECAVSENAPGDTGSENPQGPYRLVAKPDAVQYLKEAGINIVSLANNHSADAGPEGLQEADQTLREAGILSVGAGPDEISAASPVIIQQSGLRIAFLAYNAVPSPMEHMPGWMVSAWHKDAVQAVRRAAVQADIVIVSIHWGYEFETRADPAQAEQARALMAAGADLVIGHHPHVPQEILLQRYAGEITRFTAFSLGNFVFDQGQEGSRQGLALRAFFDRQGLRAAQIIPIEAGPRPRLGKKDSSYPPVTTAQPPYRAIAFTCQKEACQELTGGVRHPELQAGIFRSAGVDLTGDHIPEEVVLSGGQLVIFEHGTPGWTSPSTWQVLDVAVGDPDADGRSDLVLALEKPDASGGTQSHPFLIGFRGGVYRTIWGGSPVRDPLKEVELGDLDNDGQVELVVLEEERGGKGRAVTLWHWHGWGFSLDWRSPYAQYENMVVSENQVWVNRISIRP